MQINILHNNNYVYVPSKVEPVKEIFYKLCKQMYFIYIPSKDEPVQGIYTNKIKLHKQMYCMYIPSGVEPV